MKSCVFVLVFVLLSLVVAIPVAAQDAEDVAPGLEDYPAVQYWVDLWNGLGENSQDVADEYFVADFVNHLSHGRVYRGVAQGRTSFLSNVRQVRISIPDFVIDVEEVIAAENAVVIRYTISGTDPDSDEGDTFESLGFAIFHLNDDGLIEEVWNWYNQCTAPWITCTP